MKHRINKTGTDHHQRPPWRTHPKQDHTANNCWKGVKLQRTLRKHCAALSQPSQPRHRRIRIVLNDYQWTWPIRSSYDPAVHKAKRVHVGCMYNLTLFWRFLLRTRSLLSLLSEVEIMKLRGVSRARLSWALKLAEKVHTTSTPGWPASASIPNTVHHLTAMTDGRSLSTDGSLQSVLVCW